MVGIEQDFKDREKRVVFAKVFEDLQFLPQVAPDGDRHQKSTFLELE